MESILDKIIEAKLGEVSRHKVACPIEALKKRIDNLPMPLNFSGALMGDRVSLIAEFKRRSPSRGLLNNELSAEQLAKIYPDSFELRTQLLKNKEVKAGVWGLTDEHTVPIFNVEKNSSMSGLTISHGGFPIITSNFIKFLFNKSLL